MADTQLKQSQVTTAPSVYNVPANAEAMLKSVSAVFTDNGAASDWLPCLTIVSDAGLVVADGVDQGVKITAGQDARVSWFPGVKPKAAASSGSGIQYDVDNVGDWLSVETNGTEDKGVAFDVKDDGGFTVGDDGDGGIAFRDNGTGGVSFVDGDGVTEGTAGITFSENGRGGIRFQDVDQVAANSGGILLQEGTGNGGISLQDLGTGGISLEGTSTGGIFLIDSGRGGVFFFDLPTSLPAGSKQVWNNSGVLSITP